LARWKLPSLELSIADLGEGVALAATLTHKQDRVLVMREGGGVAVYDVADGRKRLEVAPQDTEAKFYSSALAVSPDDQLVAAASFIRATTGCSGASTPGNGRLPRPPSNI